MQQPLPAAAKLTDTRMRFCGGLPGRKPHPGTPRGSRCCWGQGSCPVPLGKDMVLSGTVTMCQDSGSGGDSQPCCSAVFAWASSGRWGACPSPLQHAPLPGRQGPIRDSAGSCLHRLGPCWSRGRQIGAWQQRGGGGGRGGCRRRHGWVSPWLPLWVLSSPCPPPTPRPPCPHKATTHQGEDWMLRNSSTLKWRDNPSRGLGQAWAPPTALGAAPSPPTWPCRQRGGHTQVPERVSLGLCCTTITPDTHTPAVSPALTGEQSPLTSPLTPDGGTAELHPGRAGGGTAVGSSRWGQGVVTVAHGQVASQQGCGGIPGAVLGVPRDEARGVTQALTPSGPQAQAGHGEDFARMTRKAQTQGGSSAPPAPSLHPQAAG